MRSSTVFNLTFLFAIPTSSAFACSLFSLSFSFKASAKRNKAEKKALKKDAEERLERLQAEARESEAQMVAAMEAEVQKVLAEKEAEFDGARASDAKVGYSCLIYIRD